MGIGLTYDEARRLYGTVRAVDISIADISNDVLARKYVLEHTKDIDDVPVFRREIASTKELYDKDILEIKKIFTLSAIMTGLIFLMIFIGANMVPYNSRTVVLGFSVFMVFYTLFFYAKADRKNQAKKLLRWDDFLAKSPIILSALDSLTAEDFGNAQSAAVSSHPQAMMSSADELKKFAELRDDGVITEEDFQKKKNELLGL
jgi:hypothetical protein